MKTVLLDTHVLIWLFTDSPKLKGISWLKKPSYYTVSPVSLLELKFLNECGRLNLSLESLIKQLQKDENFHIDSVDLSTLCFAAFNLEWTRDPFDRLITAHSLAKKITLGTCDHLILKNHKLLA